MLLDEVTEQSWSVWLTSVTEDAYDRLFGSCLKTLIALEKLSMMASQEMLSKPSRGIDFVAKMAVHVVDWEGSGNVCSGL